MEEWNKTVEKEESFSASVATAGESEAEREGGCLPEEGLKTADASPIPVSLSKGEEQEKVAFSQEEEERVDWKARCERAEQSLDDAWDFARLYAPHAEALDSWRESGVYKRFCQLRALGLSVKEAFSAANCQNVQAVGEAAAFSSKTHLTSSVPKGFGGGVRLSGDELMIARELLGDSYSGDELAKLYRRVVKS